MQTRKSILFLQICVPKWPEKNSILLKHFSITSSTLYSLVKLSLSHIWGETKSVCDVIADKMTEMP